MENSLTRVNLKIDGGAEVDEAELERLTLSLQDELRDLKIESIDLLRKENRPPGAKSGDPVIWGNLLLALVASGGVITSLIGMLQSWVTRQERRSVTLEIGGDKLVISSLTSRQQQQLVTSWINRHKTGGVKE